MISFSSVSQAEETGKPAVELSPDEQNSKAFLVFQRILDLTENNERATVLPQLEAAYLEIIQNYPKASVTQEGYWRLVSMYVSDYNPPLFEKAENIYNEFIRKFSDSNTRALIEETLSNSYYKNSKWEQLLRLHKPVIKQYIETGKLSRPLEMHRYSEAKYYLKDLSEAEKGYKIIISLFPNSHEASISKARLEEIKKKQSK